MDRRRVTLELDENLLDAAQAVAERAGVPEGELYERALREVLAGDFQQLMNEITAHQSAIGVAMTDDEALAVATEEVRAARAEARVARRRCRSSRTRTCSSPR